jgi:hypothetical protein
MFEKKFAKKVRKYYKLSEGRGGRGGREGGELSFKGLRPSTSLMAAGKNGIHIIGFCLISPTFYVPCQAAACVLTASPRGK